MIPKEKALELFNRVFFRLPFSMDNKDKILYAKMFALIIVDDLIKYVTEYGGKNYWQEVKKEIEKL